MENLEDMRAPAPWVFSGQTRQTEDVGMKAAN